MRHLTAALRGDRLSEEEEEEAETLRDQLRPRLVTPENG